MSNPYQTPPPDPYGGAPGYGQQPGYGYAQPAQPPYDYQQQTPYPAQQPPPGYGTVATPQPNQLATASVAVGVISILGMCLYGGLLGPIAIGLGVGGLLKSRTLGVGRSAAIGGIVLGVLSTLIVIALLVWTFVLDGQV